jgi:hypothetical protein
LNTLRIIIFLYGVNILKQDNSHNNDKHNSVRIKFITLIIHRASKKIKKLIKLKKLEKNNRKTKP